MFRNDVELVWNNSEGEQVAVIANPAAFGPDMLEMPDGVTGVLATAHPFDGCKPLANADAISGRIAVVRRGGCNFVDKVRNAERVGAIAVVILDNRPVNAPHHSPFTMTGDDIDDTAIPAVFVTTADGGELLDAMSTTGPLRASMNGASLESGEECDDVD